MMKIGEKIAILRKNRGMTQAELAEKLAFTRQAIQKWESGQTSPDVYTVPMIAEVFSISVDSLLSPNISDTELIAESLGLNKQKSEANISPANFFNYVMWMPILAIIVSFIGISYIILFFLFLFGFLAPLIDLGVFALAIYQLIDTANSGIPMILIYSGVIVLSIGLAYPAWLLFTLTRRELKNVIIHLNGKTKTILHKVWRR